LKITVSGKRADPGAAWRLIGDTDFMNRAAGNGQLTAVDLAMHQGEPTAVGLMDGPFGMKIPFRDVEVSWVAGRYLKQHRAYDHVGLKSTKLVSRLEPDGDGVIPHVELEMELGTPLLRPLATRQAWAIEREWRRLLDALPAPGQDAPAPEGALSAPAKAALQKWAGHAPAPIVARFERLLLEGHPVELQSMRPFVLADRWKVDREEVLVGMLGGVDASALELYWSVRCVRCLGQAGVAASLSDLADHATCPACRIQFEADLGSNVEVMFAWHPAVAPRLQGRFCTLFPTLAPDQRALFHLAPGEQVVDAVPLEAGDWKLGVLGPQPEVGIEALPSPDAPPVLKWTPSTHADARVRAGEVRLELQNDRQEGLKVQIVPAKPPQDRVPASLLTTLPAYRRRVGAQVLSKDTRISVRAVTLLFTDLTGSTEMYEELGDAEAYALVRDHFDLLRAVVEAHGGVIVKTIGDAIMASFHTPERGVTCAFALQERFQAWVRSRGLEKPLGLRVGLHAGPSLVVHTDGLGMDYFGRTVNLAARAQGAAEGGEIVWTGEVHEDPAVRHALTVRGAVPEPIEKTLKGLRGVTTLYRLGT
jgi:adenylate cyclase